MHVCVILRLENIYVNEQLICLSLNLTEEFRTKQIPILFCWLLLEVAFLTVSRMIPFKLQTEITHFYFFVLFIVFCIKSHLDYCNLEALKYQQSLQVNDG